MLNIGYVIEDRYSIANLLRKGRHSIIYIAEDVNNANVVNHPFYIIKYAKNNKTDFMLNEKRILTRLNNDNYVPHIHSNIQGTYYLVMECLENNLLSKYIHEPNIYFDELHTKLIFKRILKCVQYCHNNKICHLDIKLNHILLGNNYIIKLADFSSSKEIIENNGVRQKFRGNVGTKNYRCPEIMNNSEYDGIKADIFSLGVLLYYLFTKKNPFDDAQNGINLKNNNYDFDYFSQMIKNNISNEKLPDKLIKLYVKMVSYYENERPTIEEILNNDEWLEEIRNYGEARENNEIAAKFQYLNNKIIDMNNIDVSSTINFFDGNKCGTSTEIYFKNDEKKNKIFKPKKIEEKNCDPSNNIIINGNIEPVNFMNTLVNKVIEDYKKEGFDISHKYLKFSIIFDNEDEEEKKEEKEKEEKEADENIIGVEIFELKENKYVIKISIEEGEIKEFYKHFVKLREIIKKLFN